MNFFKVIAATLFAVSSIAWAETERNPQIEHLIHAIQSMQEPREEGDRPEGLYIHYQLG